jgi:hypothetical protein
LSSGPEQEREPIGVLLARLIEEARALAKAELALFRTDFYRRIGRARTGALLCLIGAIMGQAAAVTFLVTLSFVLTPWIGRLGGAAVSVLLGLGLAIALIKIGVSKLMLVVEDFEEDDSNRPKGIAPLDELFDRMRQKSREARNRLAETVDETQARLHPQALIADLIEEIVDHAQAFSHRAIDAARLQPLKATAAVVTLVLLIVRPPLYRIGSGLFRRATRGSAASFTNNQAGRPAPSSDEETRS